MSTREIGVAPRARRLVALSLLALAGCAIAPEPAELRASIEQSPPSTRRGAVRGLRWVASSREDDCGPCALGTVLAAAGTEATLDSLRAQVYDPARGGAPASALVRAARDRDLFALVRESWYLDDLKSVIRAGVAPIVLLEASPLAPGRFHYVVLKGYDDDRRALLVQDQETSEYALSYDSFFPRWCLANGWALVVCSPSIVLPPDQMGLRARELGALGWLAEMRGDLESARRHYRAALLKDPDFESVAHNLANVERALATRGVP
jgi:predicted double-glycine peptidase